MTTSPYDETWTRIRWALAGAWAVIVIGWACQGCTAAQTRDTLNAVKTAIPWVCGGAKPVSAPTQRPKAGTSAWS